MNKMSLNDRARQFLPFDAQKGLKEAIRLKEIEYERIKRRDIDEDKCAKISDTLLNVEKNELVEVTYFEEGYYNTITGKIKIKIEEESILVDKKIIKLFDLYDIKILKDK